MEEFKFKNFTICNLDEKILFYYKNSIGIEKSVIFYKSQYDKYTLQKKLLNKVAKSNLFTTFLYYEKEKHEKIANLIDYSFGSEFERISK